MHNIVSKIMAGQRTQILQILSAKGFFGGQHDASKLGWPRL